MAKTKQEILAELKANPSYKPTSTLSPTKQAILQEMKLVSKTGFNADRSRITKDDMNQFKGNQNALAEQTDRMNSFAVDDESDLEVQRRLAESTRDMSLRNDTEQQKMTDYAIAKKVIEEPAYGKGFIDTTRANLGVGQLQQDSALKWSKFINDPTLNNKRSAEAMDLAFDVYRRRQEQALYDQDADGNLKERGNWLSKDIAQYLPQFADQMQAQIPAQIGALAIGAMTGGAGYASAAQVLGAAASGKQSFDVMRGAAYRGLKELGVSDELALKISGEEALINAIIESAGTLAGMQFLGFGKLFQAIGSVGASGVANILAKEGMKKAAQSSLGKVAQVLGKYGITGYLGNIASESIEEGLQEGVSILQEKRAMAQEGIERTATGKDDLNRILQNAAGGAKIAAVMGAPGVAVTQSGQYLINKNNARVNEALAKDVRTAKSANEAQDAGIAARREKIVQSYDKGLDELFRNVGDAGTNAYTESINDIKSSDEQEYKAEFIKAYNAGLSTQKSFEESSLLIGSVDNTERAKRFFEAGQKDSARIREESAALWNNTQVAVKKERAMFVANQQPGLLNDEYSAKLDNYTQKALDVFAKGTQTKIVIAPNVGSIDGQAVVDPASFEGFAAQNGFYDPKSKAIYLNADLEDKTFGVTVHEITHTIKEMNNPGYKAFSDLALKVIEEQQGKDAYKRYASWALDTYGVELTIDQAKEELVSNEMARVLNDPEKFLAKYGKVDQSFGQRIVSAVRNVLRKIKKAFANRSLSKEERASLQAYEKQMQEMESKWVEALKGAKEAVALVRDDEIEISDTMFSMRELDKETLDFLNNQKHIKVFRAMQVIDGELYPPMAAKVKDESGKKSLVIASKLGAWEQAVERPDLITKGNKFTLDKANGSSIEASYNPYFHTSLSPLNDQFSSAYKRDNLVVVEGFVPSSELTSGYKAQYAKDPVGEMSWHSGPVSSKLSKGKERKIILSRWFKPARILTDAEVARNIANLLEGENVEIPYNTVTPSLRAELNKAGVPIKGDVRYSLRDSDGRELTAEQAEFFKDSKVRDKDGNLLRVYHGTDAEFTVFDKRKIGSATDNGMWGRGFYFADNRKTPYGTKTMEAYLDIRNPLILSDFKTETNLADYLDIDESILTQDYESGLFRPLNSYIAAFTSHVKENGHDGIFVTRNDSMNEYVAFSPSQIKSIDNLNPTENEDIRYSLRGSETFEKKLKRENKLYKQRYKYFKSQLYQTKGKPDRKKVKKWSKEFLKLNQSTMSDVDFENKAMEIYEALYEANQKTSDPTVREYAEALSQELAKEVLSFVRDSLVIENDAANEIRAYLRNIKIIPYDIEQSELNQFKKRFRRVKFATATEGEKNLPNVLSLDSAYKEMAEKWPDIFDSKESQPQKMLEQIAAATEASQTLSGYISEFDIDEFVPDVAMQILEGYEENKLDQTFADKQKEMRVELATKVNQEVKRVYEQANERVKKNEEKANLQAAARVMRVQKQADAKLKAMREREAQKSKVIRNTYERIEASGLRKTIHKQLNKLNSLAKNPTDQKHLPMPLERAITDLISVLRPIENNQSVRDTVFGDREALVIKNAVDAFRKVEAESEGGDAFLMDVDLPDNLSDLGEILKRKSFNSVKAELRMSMDDLKLMQETLASIMQMVNYQNKLFSFDKAQQITDVSQKIADEIYTDKGYQVINSLEWARSLLDVHMLAPADFADRLGPTFKGIYDKGIREGLDKKIRLLKEAEEYMTQLTKDMDIEKWSGNEAQPITAFGLTMSPAQWMSIFVSARQEQARQHMIYGGVRPTKYEAPGISNKFAGKMVASYEPVQLTERDIESIGDLLSADQKKVAIGVSDFFMTHVAEWGNEISEKMYGYRKFTEKNYFPIVSDPNFLAREQIGVAATEKTLRNMGSTKKRLEGAKNPIYAEDIFDVFSNHVDKYSSYNGFVPGLSDMQRIYNAQVMQGSIKGLIEKRYGAQMQGYFKKLMIDINGGMRKEPEAHPATWLISRYKSAKIGANLKVVVQQPTTLVRAAAMIDPKYLIQGLGGKADWETVKQYAPIAQWKDWGYFTLDVGRQLKSVLVGKENFKDAIMKPIEAADRFAWLKLWRAVELETTDLKPNLAGEEFYQEVGKRFSEIVDRTQVVDTVLHRTGFMRGDAMAKSLSSFMSEPMKNYNLMKTAWVKYSQNKTKANLKNLQRSVATVFVTTAVTGVAVVMMGMYRDKEDTEEEFFKRFSKDWLLYMIKEPAGMVPLARDFLSLLEGYSVERMDMSLLSSLIKAMGQLGDGKLTPAERARRMFVAVSELSGIPTGSASREVSDLTRNLLTVFNSYEGMFAVKALEYNIRNAANAPEFIDVLFQAHKGGDIDSYDRMAKTLMENGITYDTIVNGMRRRYKKTGNVPAEFAARQSTSSSTVKVFEVTKETLKPAEAEDYQVAYRRYLKELTAEMQDEPIYQKADDALKVKIDNAIMDYSDSKAMEEASKLYVEKTAWINQVEQAEIKADLSAEAFIAFLEGRKAYGASVGASGVTQEETTDFIDDQDYTRLQKAALWDVLYPKSKNPFR